MRENMRNLAKYAVHICCICRYMRHIFFAYFQHMQLQLTENHNHDHRPILHIFDIFDLMYSTSNCKYRQSFAAKNI